MNKVIAYKDDKNAPGAKIRRLNGKRDWMHSITYNCYPLSFANTMGYGVYFEEDVSFIWDGHRDHPAEGILGKEHIWSGRGEGTVSFSTNLIFKTEENLSMLTLPVPNNFVTQDATCITTLLATSFLTTDFPIVWKIHTPNKEIVIPAGTDIACLLPISVGQLQDSEIIIKDQDWPYERVHNTQEYVTYLKKEIAEKRNPRMYKRGVDHKERKIGNHEVDNLRLNVTYEGEQNG